jgi:hypothetical protein
MTNTNVLQRSAVFIDKGFVHLVQNLETLNDMAEDGMFPV